METADTSGYPSGNGSRNAPDKGLTDYQLKTLLEKLISSSRTLNVRIWLDGVFTDLEGNNIQGEWMKGREVYFKVEGSVDQSKNGGVLRW